MSRRDRLLRAFSVSMSISLIIAIVVEVVWFWNYLETQEVIGLDYRWFAGAAQRWVDTGQFYVPRQLAGPYVVETLVDVLYPPNALLLFVPFLVLPALLWWLVPLSVFAIGIIRLRPVVWAWPLILAGVAWPPTISQILYGNTNMWVAAAVAAGVCWAWPSVLVLLKPSLLPFALFGSNRRSWWIALGLLVIVSLPFGTMWLDYVAAMRNANLGPLYALHTVPFFLAPLVAWVARTRDLPTERPFLRLPWPRQRTGSA